MTVSRARTVAAALMLTAAPAFAQGRLQSSDLLRLRSVSAVQLSPDATRVAYVVDNNDGAGRPYPQVFVMTIADGQSIRFGGEHESSNNPEWSPDGRWVAYRGRAGVKTGLVVARPDGTGTKFLAEITDTNAPLPGAGKSVAWSPDSTRLAFVSAVPGPETSDVGGDPRVITRYLYKPDAAEGTTRFNDNRRLHLYIVDVASAHVQQLTEGTHYEHSIDWSPNGEELLFLTNRDADDDEFFNYDVFALKLADRSVRRLTATESNEYRPRWSPDGKTIAFEATRRGLTDRETTMEDTHVWVMNADGTNRHEVGRVVDNRQGAPAWTDDGAALMFTVQERGKVGLYRAPVGCGAAASSCQLEPVAADRGAVGSFSVAKNTVAYTYASTSDLAKLYVRVSGGAARKLTDLNTAVLAGKPLADVESFTFVSNDNRFEVKRS